MVPPSIPLFFHTKDEQSMEIPADHIWA